MKRPNFSAPLLRLLLGSAALVACSGGSGHEIDSTSQAIHHALNDTTNQFPQVAFGRFADNDCTGTLVTGQYVLTANHCIIKLDDMFGDSGPADNRGKTVDWYFTNDINVRAGSWPLLSRATGSRDPYRYRKANFQFTFATVNETGSDVGLVRLDKLVPSSVIKPLRPAGIGDSPVCSGGPSAPNLIVGFGLRASGEEADKHWRGYNFVDPMSYETDGDEARWDDHVGAYSYRGIDHGDSGGPLFSNANDGDRRVCGVASGTGINLGADKAMYHAATESGANRQFLEQFLWDKNKKKWLTDYCPLGGADTDGDFVPDLCDNCKATKNPDQEDMDRDGVGDVCDNCISVPNPDQSDANLDAEIETNGKSSVFADPDDRTRMTVRAPGDACEPNPVATVTSDSNFSAVSRPKATDNPNNNPRKAACNVKYFGFCGTNVEGQCPVSIGNVVTTVSSVTQSYKNDFWKAETGEAVEPVAQVLANTRTARCKCAEGTAMAECRRQGCDHVGRPDDSLAESLLWQKMDLAYRDSVLPIVPAATQTYKGETFLQTRHPAIGSPAAGSRHGVPETKLFEWRYWNDPGIMLSPVSAARTPIFNGVVWTWVKSFNRSAQPLISDPSTGDFLVLRRLRSSVARLDVAEQPVGNKSFSCLTPPKKYPIWHPSACPSCRFGEWLEVFEDRVNGFRPGFGSAQTVGTLPPEATDLINKYPALRTVVASDANWVPPGERSVVFLDAGNEKVVGSLLAAEDAYKADGSLLPTVDVIDDATAVPVVSGKRQEIRVFRPGRKVFTQYLQSGDREQLQLLNGVELNKPLAATFRGEDDSYFVLDDIGAGKIRLWRFDVAMTGTLLAEWSGVPSSRTFSLTTTGEGDLLLQRGTSDGARAWRLEVAEDQTWSVTNFAQTTGNGLGTRAYATSLGTVVFMPADARLATEATFTVLKPAPLSTLQGAL